MFILVGRKARWCSAFHSGGELGRKTKPLLAFGLPQVIAVGRSNVLV